MRLCRLSSGERRVRGLNFEVFEVFEEGVESDEKFPGDGDEGDVVGFIGSSQFFVERGEVGAVLGGGFGGHVEGFADDFSSAVDPSFADPFSGLLRVRSDARDGGDSLSREGSEFGEVGQQDAGGLGADAGRGLEGGVRASETSAVALARRSSSSAMSAWTCRSSFSMRVVSCLMRRRIS